MTFLWIISRISYMFDQHMQALAVKLTRLWDNMGITDGDISLIKKDLVSIYIG